MNQQYKEKKSVSIQLLLTLFLGPFGLFYSNTNTAVVLSVICMVTMPAFGLGFFLCWPAAQILGVMFVQQHNNMVLIFKGFKSDELSE